MTARDEGAAGRRFPAALEALVLLAVPVALVVCGWFQFDQTALLTFAVAAGALGLFFAGFERSKPALRQVVPTFREPEEVNCTQGEEVHVPPQQTSEASAKGAAVYGTFSGGAGVALSAAGQYTFR